MAWKAPHHLGPACISDDTSQHPSYCSPSCSNKGLLSRLQTHQICTCCFPLFKIHPWLAPSCYPFLNSNVTFWRRKWQPTPVFLPGESHGQRNQAGYSPWGHKESDTTEQLNTVSPSNPQVDVACCLSNTLFYHFTLIFSMALVTSQYCSYLFVYCLLGSMKTLCVSYSCMNSQCFDQCLLH